MRRRFSDGPPFFSVIGIGQTLMPLLSMSASGGKADHPDTSPTSAFDP